MKLSRKTMISIRVAVIASVAGLLSACGSGSSSNSDSLLPIAPSVILTIPATSTPIVTDVATNISLKAKFSQDMLSTSINTSSFTVSCDSPDSIGVVTVLYDAVNRLAILQHTDLFPEDTTCTATITTAAKNTSGTALARNYSWQFATGDLPDIIAPTVLFITPEDATGVCTTKDVSIVFSEPMDSSTINSDSFVVSTLIDDVSTPIAGVVTYNAVSNTAKFAVSAPGYADDIDYAVTITTAVRDLAGIAIADPYTSSFTGDGTICGAPAVTLGSIATYGGFGGDAGVTNQGLTTRINGDLGTTAVCTSITGLRDSQNTFTVTALNDGFVTGQVYCAPPAPGTTETLAIATLARSDALAAYDEITLKTQPIPVSIPEGQLGGTTQTSGIYDSVETMLITSGNLTLDAQGNPDAVFIFRAGSSLTVGAPGLPRSVILIGGAQAKNVFWRVVTAARIEDGSTMIGTIIAKAGVTISTADQTDQTTLLGRAIGLDASVTMVNTVITIPE